jgi:hypothetical protein
VAPEIARSLVSQRDNRIEPRGPTRGPDAEKNEVRRRTKVIGIFPHEASLLRLVTALAIDWTERFSKQRYLVSLPNLQRSG